MPSVVSASPHQKALKAKPGAGGMTAINPYYTIFRATELWGPAGDRWGWTILSEDVDSFRTADGLEAVHRIRIKLWHPPSGNTGHLPSVEAVGCTTYRSAKGRVDEDAAKKSLTDAITKALSYVGFSADVWNGKVDHRGGGK